MGGTWIWQDGADSARRAIPVVLRVYHRPRARLLACAHPLAGLGGLGQGSTV